MKTFAWIVLLVAIAFLLASVNMAILSFVVTTCTATRMFRDDDHHHDHHDDHHSGVHPAAAQSRARLGQGQARIKQWRDRSWVALAAVEGRPGP